MKIAILGTGMVGRALAGRLAALGHDVVIGTRDVEVTLARTEPDGMGNPPYATWARAHPDVRLLPLPQAGEHGEVVVNATAGAASLAALDGVGTTRLAGKVLLDLALPLDFSTGMPPSFLVLGDDSLGEQIQRSHPDARVVKTLNTVFCEVMVDPARVPGHHSLFLAGDDDAAKQTVRGLLNEFGWADDDLLDLGGIERSRATEMYMMLYFTLHGVLGDFDFNIGVVHRTGAALAPA